jgi:arsenate reductase
MIKVMFLCTGNSCRSQMAEGFAKESGKGLLEVQSAGLSPHGVNPRAIAVMKEIGIDISGQTSKSIDQELLGKMDMVITLCGNAAESCPWTPPGIKRIHWPLEDPAKATGTEKEIMNEFRRIRDEVGKRVKNLAEEMRNG